jgi:hypothetical protein
LIFSSGSPWREQRRFTLKNLRDFGFGRSSMEHLIKDELKELVAEIRPSHIPNDESNVVVLDSALNAAVTNVIWWMVASMSSFHSVFDQQDNSYIITFYL